MNENHVFRANARAQLGGQIFANHWLMVLVVCLIQNAIISVASSVIPVVSLLFGAFLYYGLARVLLQLIRGQKDRVDIGDLFCGSDKLGDLIVLGLMKALLTFAWALLFVIPGIVKSYAYSMAIYIKHDHPDYDWKRCIDESIRMMDGNKWQLFCLDFSFIGWYIVGALCCLVGTLWVTPYHEMARANFYENLKAIYDPDIQINVEEPAADNGGNGTEAI